MRAGREQLRNIEQQVLLNAVTAYGDVVRDQSIVKLQESNLSFLTTELMQLLLSQRCLRRQTPSPSDASGRPAPVPTSLLGDSAEYTQALP